MKTMKNLNELGHRKAGAMIDELLKVGVSEEEAMTKLLEKYPDLPPNKFRRHIYWSRCQGSAILKRKVDGVNIFKLVEIPK